MAVVAEAHALQEEISKLAGLVVALQQTWQERQGETAQRGAPHPELTEKLAAIEGELQDTRRQVSSLEAQLSAARVLHAADTEASPEGPGYTRAEAAWLEHVKTGEPLPEDVRKDLVADDKGRRIIPRGPLNRLRQALEPLSVVKRYAAVTATTRDREPRGQFTDVTVWWGPLELELVDAETRASTFEPLTDDIYVEDVNGLAKLGVNLLADSNIDVERALIRAFTNAMIGQEDPMFVAGAGHAQWQPQGLLATREDGTPILPRIPAGQPGALTLADVKRLKYSLPQVYRLRKPIFLTSDENIGILALITNAEGNFMWQPRVSEDVPDRLDGHPIYAVGGGFPPLPAPGSAGPALIFADLSMAYEVLDRKAIVLEVLREKYRLKGKHGYLFHLREGGGIVYPQAGRVLEIPAS